MDRFRITLFVLSCVLLPVACLEPQSDASLGLVSRSSSSTTTPTTTTDSSLSGDLYLKVSTAWETTPTQWLDQITCQIPTGSVTTALPCAGAIPEGQLHFSKLKFTLGTSNPGACKMLIFFPYFYRASNAASYTPPWDPAVSPICNDTASALGGPVDVNCYDGVGIDIIPDFPNARGVYTLTADTLQTSYDTPSSSEKNRPTNRYACNNKVDPTAPVANYVASTMQAYRVECRDQYYTLLKSITLTLGDIDLEAGETPGLPNDDFNDWLAP